MNFRFVILAAGIFFAFSSLIFKLYDLQINKGSFYYDRAVSQLSGVLEARRGIIYLTDKNNNSIPAALNKEYPVAFAVPKDIDDASEAAQFLAQVFELEADALRKKLSREKSEYEPLAVKISDEQFKKIREAGLKGISLHSKEFRFYPFQELAAHVLGFVGLSSKDSEIKGRYGIEAYFDETLGGRPGEAGDEKIIDPVHGADLNLAIDRNIQAQAEQILSKTINENGAVGGTVIVQEPSTGKILALANNPAFDPNSYGKFSIRNFLNPAVEAVYEPGSVIKVLTMAAGIDAGKITPETKFNDSGSVTLNGKTIKNYKDKIYGTVTMNEVIAESINTGAVFAVRRGGHQNFYDYLVKFGFNERTGIKLPGEVKGSITNLIDSPRDIDFATAAFGQGISVTPLRLISSISAIANKGVLMRPYFIVSGEPQIIRRVLKPETAETVTQMMVQAVKKAKIAHIPEFNIAGKTGTAQIPDSKRGGYKDEFIHSFVGFAPAKSPRFTILIKIDKPAGGHPAAVTVVPAFRELAQFILNYHNIPPDNLETSE